MKRKRLIIAFVIIIALAIIFVWRQRNKTPELVLATEKPHYGYIANSVTATGTIQPVDTVAVGTQVSGIISKVYADFNSVVKKGQLLAELDKTILNAQVQQIAASLQQAQSQINYQESNYKRQEELYKVGAISKAELETAQNAYKVAQANVQGVRSQLQASQKNLSLANIYSPIDGTVLSRNVSEGQTVAASFSTPTLFSIAKDLTQMQVRAAVDEADIGNVQKGQRVSFTVDAFPDDVFNGTLQEIRLQPSISSNVVTYATIINAPNDQLKLKPGMTANITVYTKEQDSALLISAKATKFKPDSAMMKKYDIPDERKNNREQNRSNTSNPVYGANSSRDLSRSKDSSAKRATVWIINGKTLTRRSIRTGLEDGTQVQVLSGLSTTDEIVSGIQQSGTKVNQNSNVRSPFMPPRRGGQGNRSQQSSSRPNN